MADPKDFVAVEGAPPEKNQNLTRTGIMLALLPVIQATLAGIPGFDMVGNKAHLRRTVRALTTLAMRMMLDAGAPPQIVADQLFESLAHEVDERQKAAEAQGAAQATEAAEAGGAPIFAKAGDPLKN